MTLIVYDLQKNINYNQTNSFELTQKKNQNTFCLKQSAPIWVISYRIISVLSYAVTFDTSRGLLMLQSNVCVLCIHTHKLIVITCAPEVSWSQHRTQVVSYSYRKLVSRLYLLFVVWTFGGRTKFCDIFYRQGIPFTISRRFLCSRQTFRALNFNQLRSVHSNAIGCYKWVNQN